MHKIFILAFEDGLIQMMRISTDTYMSNLDRYFLSY